MGFVYTIEYLPGDVNVWADIMSRWGAAPIQVKRMFVSRLQRLFSFPLSILQEDSNFDFPDAQKIFEAQSKGKDIPPDAKLAEDMVLRLANGKIWIPDEDKELQMRLCVIAHCAAGGHRGAHATATALADTYQWSNMRREIESFCQKCYHCMATWGNKRIPRPLGEALHSDKPGEILHQDWLYMKKLSTKGPQYLDVQKDDATNYVWLTPAQVPTALETANHIEKWMGCFMTPKYLVSDGGSHFKNEVVKELTRRYGITHHITLAYCPWSNGTVESMMSQVIKTFRALLSEFRMKPEQWPELVNMVQAALNAAPSDKLGGISPLEAFTGLKPQRPFDTFLHPSATEVTSMAPVKASLKKELELLVQRRDDLHKATGPIAARKRDRERARTNDKTGVKFANIMEGDFVMVARDANVSGQKLSVRWRGPRRVTKVLSDWVYEVEDLVKGTKSFAHATRIRLYADKDLEVTEDLRTQLAHNECSFTVEKFTGLRYNDETSQWELLTQWLGFEEADASWEPLLVLAADTQVAVRKYFEGAGKTHAKAAECIALLKAEDLWTPRSKP